MNLESDIGNILKKRKLSLSIAESCTGGLISHRMTNIPGSSSYFDRGMVVYSNQAKVDCLNVDPQVIEKYGAVSGPTAKEMAIGVRKISKTDIGVSVTGIAGPGGGTKEKPVGLVYIAVCLLENIIVREFRFSGDRENIKCSTSEEALKLLNEVLQLQD